MAMTYVRRPLATLAATATLAMTSLSCFAGGFQLTEQNASGLGNAYTGTSALVEDASVGFYNPAGLTFLCKPEVSASGVMINLNDDVRFRTSVSNSLFRPDPPFPPAFVGGDKREEAGGWHPIPALHIAYPFHHNQWAVGLSITSPFGLTTSYTKCSRGRYLATYSNLTTFNIGPTVSWRPFPCFSIGAGIDGQYISVDLSQQVAVGSGFKDATLKQCGDDWAYGWNVGALYEIPQYCTRIGIAYRSRIHYCLEGDVKLFGLPSPPLPGSNFPGSLDARLTVPDYATLSLVKDFGCAWRVLASVSWIHWGLIDTVNVRYSGPITASVPGASLDLAFCDSWRYNLAVNYCPTQCWKFRLGVMYDESPVQGQNTRTLRLPDNDRVWVGIGGNYHINNTFDVDFAYSHIFVDATRLRQTQPSSSGIAQVSARVYGSVNLFGLQLNAKFDAF